jgi:tetratricopeptide (TPR) repeat protein
MIKKIFNKKLYKDITKIIIQENRQYTSVFTKIQANNAMKQSLKIQEEIHGKGSIKTTGTLFNLGELYKYNDDYEKSKKFLLDCLKIQENHYEKGDIKTEKTINNLGEVMFLNKEYQEAINYFEQSLEILEKTHTEEVITMYPIKRLIELHNIIYSPVKVKLYCDKFIKLNEKHERGEEECEEAYLLLAQMHLIDRELEDSKYYYEKILKIRKNDKGIKPNLIKEILVELCKISGLMDDKNEMKKYEKELNEIK